MKGALGVFTINVFNAQIRWHVKWCYFTAFLPNEEALEMIMNMGFNRAQAIKALEATDNNVERALDWIFSHAAELDNPSPDNTPPPVEFRDGSESM